MTSVDGEHATSRSHATALSARVASRDAEFAGGALDDGFAGLSGATPRPSSGLDPWILATVDLAACVAATLVAGLPSLTAFVLLGATLATLALIGEHRRPRLRLSGLIDLPRVVGRCALVLLVLVSLDSTFQPVDRWVYHYAVALTVAVAVGRFASFTVIRRLRKAHVLSEATLIIGGGQVARQLDEALRAHPELGLRPIAIVDEDVGVGNVVGTLRDVPAIIERHHVTRVILAYGLHRDDQMVRLIRRFPGQSIELFIVPRLFEAGGGAGDPLVEDVRGIPLIWLRRRSCRSSQLRAKRTFDVLVAGALCVLTLPLMAMLAISVRLSSRGPILFRQCRIGRFGREFSLMKFRSMRTNSDSDTTWSVTSDVRVTRIGRFMRRTSLDELPQLFNVLKGDMSLVGPRPERPYFVQQFARDIEGYDDRHRCPAGLTGLAQVSGLRGDTSIDDRTRFDNHYIDQWSIWGDLVILFRTFSAALRGR